MQRLTEININTKEEYNRIYDIRKAKGVDEFDMRRWNQLLRNYKGGKLIDLGCLDSLIPIMAKGLHPRSEIWGFDQSEAIKDMESMYRQINYHVGDIYNTRFPKTYFNYVVLGEVLEHLENPELAIAEALRILKPNGTLAISVPFNEAIEPGAVDKDRHLWSFTLDDFQGWLADKGELDYRILRSIHRPIYKYCFPQLIVWLKKK